MDMTPMISLPVRKLNEKIAVQNIMKLLRLENEPENGCLSLRQSRTTGNNLGTARSKRLKIFRCPTDD